MMDSVHELSRRRFLEWSRAAAATHVLGASSLWGQETVPDEAAVRVLHPRGRVPVSFIIDDSTCLVNMGHFCMPQFATAWPDRAEYQKPWQTWPREIPDDFVREFGEWCGEHGVKGKYSIVPYPACVGWVDRELPGWSRAQLQSSLKLVRDLMVPSWDIHPEMITHTRVIELSTGRPVAEINAGTMENSFPQRDISVDELTAYLAYALRILKNCELPCEGVTTPGGFGNRVKEKLPLAVFEAVRDVYGSELPHYFKYVLLGENSTTAKLEGVSGRGTADLRLTMNVPAGTGDWFGSWDGDVLSEPDKYATADASAGRMVELLERGEPAVMLCHWPGMYSHGTKEGFRAFQRVVTSLESRFRDVMHWMKVSEIGRYQAARELTELRLDPSSRKLQLQAPFACRDFTLELPSGWAGEMHLQQGDQRSPLREIRQAAALQAGCWIREGERIRVCFDLPRGESQLTLASAGA